MKPFNVIITLLIGLFFVWNAPVSYGIVSTLEQVEIVGDDQTQVVDTENPVVIAIYGSNNTIEVADGVDVRKVTLSGYGNLVILPKDAAPEISRSGLENEVRYRTEKQQKSDKRREKYKQKMLTFKEKSQQRITALQSKERRSSLKVEERPKSVGPTVKLIELDGAWQSKFVKTSEVVRIKLAGMRNEVTLLEAASVQEIVLQGASNKVKIADGIPVKRIVLEGVRNIVELPKDSRPEIIQEGLGNKVTYR